MRLWKVGFSVTLAAALIAAGVALMTRPPAHGGPDLPAAGADLGTRRRIGRSSWTGRTPPARKYGNGHTVRDGRRKGHEWRSSGLAARWRS